MTVLTDNQKDTAAAGATGAGQGFLQGLQLAALIPKATAATSIGSGVTSALGPAVTGALAAGPAAPIALAAVAVAFGARAIKRKKDADKAAAAAEKAAAGRAKDAAKNAREAAATAAKASRTGGVVAGYETALGEAALHEGSGTTYDTWKMQ
tara:strand:+ start:517 stop:972 length:456 start_codon:yes stop_codon:yes gene_type:complete